MGAPVSGGARLAEGIPECLDLGTAIAVTRPGMVAAEVVGFAAAGRQGVAARRGARLGGEALLNHFAAIAASATWLGGDGLAKDAEKNGGNDPTSVTHGNTPVISPPILLFRTLATDVCSKNTVYGMRILRPRADGVD